MITIVIFTLMETTSILQEIKEWYELNLEYFEFDHNGETVKIRMNKDHGRNHRRNDCDDQHNLSLVNVSGDDSFFTSESWGVNYVQQQVFGISDWSDAEKAIEAFLLEVRFAN